MAPIEQPGASASRPVALAWLAVKVQAIVADGQSGPNDVARADPDDRPDGLIWMSDDSYSLLVDAGTGVKFPADSVVFVAITDVPGGGGRSAHWEIGWRSAKGEQHAFFESVGRSRFPGMTGGFADDFIDRSRLFERATDDLGSSWLGRAATESVSHGPSNRRGRGMFRRAAPIEGQ
jgi:hypothetical protein